MADIDELAALYDCCECGDYRHQHKGKNHDGACELGSLCWPGSSAHSKRNVGVSQRSLAWRSSTRD